MIFNVNGGNYYSVWFMNYIRKWKVDYNGICTLYFDD